MFRIVTFNANGVRSALTRASSIGFRPRTRTCSASRNSRLRRRTSLPRSPGFLAIRPSSTAPKRRATRAAASGAVGSPTRSATDSAIPSLMPKAAMLRRSLVISASSPAISHRGSSSEERQEAKFRFLASFLKHMDELRTSGRRVILCGDVNIAHKEIDLKNWKGNVKNSGFLPEERQWLTDLFEKHGWRDVFRLGRRQTRAVHLVEPARSGACQERRLAHRLSSGHRKRGGRRPRCVDLSGREVLGSCAAHHRLRLFSRGLTNAAQGRAFFPGLRHAL